MPRAAFIGSVSVEPKLRRLGGDAPGELCRQPAKIISRRLELAHGKPVVAGKDAAIPEGTDNSFPLITIMIIYANG